MLYTCNRCRMVCTPGNNDCRNVRHGSDGAVVAIAGLHAMGSYSQLSFNAALAYLTLQHMLLHQMWFCNC